jgi:hypothetical protein
VEYTLHITDHLYSRGANTAGKTDQRARSDPVFTFIEGIVMRTLKLACCTSVVAAALAFVPGLSSAAVIGTTEVFDITSDHCSEGTGCIADTDTSAGTITVTELGGGSLSFEIVLDSDTHFINAGFDATVAFSLSGSPTITYSDLTSGFSVVNPTVSGGLTQDAQSPAIHMDGTGDFLYGVVCSTGCPGGGASNPFVGQTVDFTITGTGVTLESLTTSTGNNSQFFAIDVLGNGTTGAVDASIGTVIPPQEIPEPGVLALLSIGLFGLGATARRRRQK